MEAVSPEPLPSPAAALTLTTGRHVLRPDCTIKGDVTIAGTATLTADHVRLLIDGNLALSGDGGLTVIRIKDSTIYGSILEVTVGGSTYRASQPFLVEPTGARP